jgi:hypothetical protein
VNKREAVVKWRTKGAVRQPQVSVWWAVEKVLPLKAGPKQVRTGG